MLLSGYLVGHPGALSIAAVEVFTMAAAVLAVLTHQWWFTWRRPIRSRRRDCATATTARSAAASS